MADRYKAYSEYKKSGVDWLHDIPSHWKTIPVGRCYHRVKRTGYESEELLSVYRDHGVIPKSSRDDNNNKASDDLSPYQLVCENNLVMNKMKAWQGSIAISEHRGIVSPAYFVYEPFKHTESIVYPKYVHYLLRHPIYITQYMSRSKGIRVNQWDLDPESFQSIELLLPLKEEQEKIIRFLDHETAKIDTLIAKQQKLIELLKEKRQAVISHVVTKGLNPHAPMKDSGVELLGEVPEHWELSKLRFISSFGRGLGITKANLHETGVPCVSYGEVHSKYGFEVNADKHALKCVSEAYLENNPECLLSEGDIIFADTSEDQDGAGNFTQISGSQRVFAGYHTVVVKLSFEIYKRFMAYVFDSESFRNQIRTSVKGVKVFSVTQAILKNSTIWLPPVKEQKAITEHLDNITSKIDRLISNQNKAIKLMRERKIALISAAVTGKIDVRDWQGEA